MNNLLKTELLNHVIQTIEDCDLESFEDLHFHAFNEDHYLIGYFQCTEWLKKHNIDTFQAIADCVNYENDNFGEVSTNYDNSETVVNMYVYIKGEELLSEFDLDQDAQALLSDLREEL